MKRKTSHIDFIALLTICIISLLSHGCSSPESRFDISDTTWAMLPFKKLDDVNPILKPGNNSFECPILKKEIIWDFKDVFNPTAIVRNKAVYMLFRAEDTVGRHNGTSRLGLAISPDGIRFSKIKNPILVPDEDFMKPYEWEGGIEDPRVVESQNGTYILTYTAYDGSIARLCVASSTDFLNWTKHGLAFGIKHENLWSKSGAIVSKPEGNKMIAQKINDKYWMYFGDTDLFIATSEDLIHWEPVEDTTKKDEHKMKSVLKPRKGYFDSRLVEAGPAAMLTERGIVLIYNGMNSGEGGDPHLEEGVYSAGQALFSATDPAQLINRLEKYFMTPDREYEITGQVNQVCFLEGLIYLNNRWLLYYGTADSKIAVAEYTPTIVQ